MFMLFKRRKSNRFDESPWKAARRDDAVPTNAPEIQVDVEREEIIMDFNKTMWVAITDEDVVDLRLNGERLQGTTALACCDRQLRIRRVRKDMCTACKEVQTCNKDCTVEVRKTLNRTLTTNPGMQNHDSSNDGISVLDLPDCNSSIGWIDHDSYLLDEDSSECSDRNGMVKPAHWVSSSEEDQLTDHWDSMQERESAELNNCSKNEQANLIVNFQTLSHNSTQHASYLCPICDICYAPKEYFMLHAKTVHGIHSILGKHKLGENRVTAPGGISQLMGMAECSTKKQITLGDMLGKNISNDSSTNISKENIAHTMKLTRILDKVVEPEFSNENSVCLRRQEKLDEANDGSRQVTEGSPLRCESYNDFLHQCPFCKEPYILKHIAEHFKEMYTTDLGLIEDGKGQNKGKYLPETGQPNQLVKMNAEKCENECIVVRDICSSDIFSSSEIQKRKMSNNCKKAVQKLDIRPERAVQVKLCNVCGSSVKFIFSHVEDKYQEIEYSVPNDRTSRTTNLKESTVLSESHVIIPTMPNYASKHEDSPIMKSLSPTSSNESNVTLPTLPKDVNNLLPNKMPNNSSTVRKSTATISLKYINMGNHILIPTSSSLNNPTSTSNCNAIIPAISTCLVMPAILNGCTMTRENSVIIPKVHIDRSNCVVMPNFTSLDYSTSIQRKHKACLCLACGFLTHLSEAQSKILEELQAVKYRCFRCQVWNDPLMVNTMETISAFSPLVLLKNSNYMLQNKHDADYTPDLDNQICNVQTCVSSIQTFNTESTLSSVLHRPISSCKDSITLQTSSSTGNCINV